MTSPSSVLFLPPPRGGKGFGTRERRARVLREHPRLEGAFGRSGVMGVVAVLGRSRLATLVMAVVDATVFCKLYYMYHCEWGRGGIERHEHIRLRDVNSFDFIPAG